MSAVDGGEWSASRAANFTTEEGGHFNHGREGVVDLRGGLEVLENKKKILLSTEIEQVVFDRPARSVVIQVYLLLRSIFILLSMITFT